MIGPALSKSPSLSVVWVRSGSWLSCRGKRAWSLHRSGVGAALPDPERGSAPSGASWLLCDSEAPSVITINQKEESQGYHQPCRDGAAQEPNYGNYGLEETGAARERSESTLRALVRVCLGRKNGNTPPLISLLHRREQFKCKR